MNEQVLEAIIERLENQKEQLNGLVADVKELKQTNPTTQFPNYDKPLDEIKTAVITVKMGLKQSQISKELITTLNRNIVSSLSQMQKPQLVKHHHYFSKAMIVSVVLLLFFILSMTIVFQVTGKLNDYKANDVKYRYLKISSNAGINNLLHRADSFYRTDVDGMKKEVENDEQTRDKQLELLQSHKADLK